MYWSYFIDATTKSFVTHKSQFMDAKIYNPIVKINISVFSPPW